MAIGAGTSAPAAGECSGEHVTYCWMAIHVRTATTMSRLRFRRAKPRHWDNNIALSDGPTDADAAKRHTHTHRLFASSAAALCQSGCNGRTVLIVAVRLSNQCRSVFVVRCEWWWWWWWWSECVGAHDRAHAHKEFGSRAHYLVNISRAARRVESTVFEIGNCWFYVLCTRVFH